MINTGHTEFAMMIDFTCFCGLTLWFKKRLIQICQYLIAIHTVA